MSTPCWALARHADQVNLSPKPGLVDRINCGAHKDMALKIFTQRAGDSGLVTRFIEFGACSAEMAPEAVLHGLRRVVWLAKVSMFRATGRKHA